MHSYTNLEFSESSLEKIFLISQSNSYGTLVQFETTQPLKAHWNCGYRWPHRWLRRGRIFFGRMFAVPARDTNYFTENKKFYVVNYSDSPFNVSRDLRQDSGDWP